MTGKSQAVSDSITIDESAVGFQTVQHIRSTSALSRVVIQQYDTTGAITSRKLTNSIIDATINNDGERAVDTASIELPMSVAAQQGNGMLYIQDIADTTFLKALYNFQYNILDESGYDLDGVSTNEGAARYSTDLGQFNATIIRTFRTAGDEITITDPYTRSDNLTGQIIDFSAQFDIYIWYKCSDTSGVSKYMLNKYDSTSNVGVQIYVTAGATGVTQVDLNGATLSITGTKQINDGNWHMLRFKRDINNVITLYTDTVVDGTPITSSTSFQPTSAHAANLVLGSNGLTGGARRLFLNGNMVQVRVYCGGILSDDDALAIYQYRPQPYTMKFGGIIYQINNTTDSKVCLARSFANPFGIIQIRPTAVGDTPSNYSNVYTNQTPQAIFTDIMTKWFPSWVFVWIPGSGSSITRYVATGNLLQNLNTLIFSASNSITFFSTARKVLIVENAANDHSVAPSKITFTGVELGGRYTITDSGRDDSVYVNDLTVMGSNDLIHRIEVTPANAAVTPFTLTGTVNGTNKVFTVLFNPVNLKVTINGALKTQVTDYALDFENKTITFSSAPAGGSIIQAEYDYETIAQGIAPLFRSQDINAIAQFGRYSKSITLPGFKDLTAVANYGTNYLEKYSNNPSGASPNPNPQLPDRTEIDSPTLCNHVRVNFKVNVVQGVKGVNTALVIKSIQFKYPSGKTIIQVGDFEYDMYDVNTATSAKVDQTNQFYVKTKNV